MIDLEKDAVGMLNKNLISFRLTVTPDNVT